MFHITRSVKEDVRRLKDLTFLKLAQEELHPELVETVVLSELTESRVYKQRKRSVFPEIYRQYFE
jgi:hypothetical protein